VAIDKAAHRNGGLRISWADIEEGMRPLREIRERVGMKAGDHDRRPRILSPPAALRIAEALREVQPLWLEDVLRVDNVATLADFRRQSGMPIAASEMLLGRKEYMAVLQAQAADYIMVDPTWNGGISETRPSSTSRRPTTFRPRSTIAPARSRSSPACISLPRRPTSSSRKPCARTSDRFTKSSSIRSR